MNWVYRVMGWFFEIPVPLTGNADLISTSRPGREKTRLRQRCRRSRAEQLGWGTTDRALTGSPWSFGASRGVQRLPSKFQKVLPFFSLGAAWADLVADDQDTHCFIEYQWYYFGTKRAILLRSCRNVYIVVFSLFFDPGFLSNILTPQLQQAEALRHSEAFRVA